MKLPLIGYDRSPAVICLEHAEQRDLLRHPEKASHYADLIAARAQRKKDRRKVVLEVDADV